MKKNLRNGSFVLTKLPRMLIMMKTVLILLVCSLNLQAAVYSQQKKFDISMKIRGVKRNAINRVVRKNDNDFDN